MYLQYRLIFLIGISMLFFYIGAILWRNVDDIDLLHAKIMSNILRFEYSRLLHTIFK